MSDDDHAPGPDYPMSGHRPAVEPVEQARRKLVGETLRNAARRAPAELDAADLTVAGGDVVQIVCVAEVMEYLEGLAIRAENGEPVP
jgi:hypothetical protein